MATKTWRMALFVATIGAGCGSPETTDPTAADTDTDTDTDTDPTDTADTVPGLACTPQPWPILTVGHQTARVRTRIATSWVPDAPRALVYVFHANKQGMESLFSVEHEELYNEFAARDLAYVLVDSTEPDWDQQLGVGNADFQRMSSVREELIASTAIEATTPVLSVGFSGGAYFNARFQSAALEAGWDARAFVSHNGGGSVVAPVDSVHVANEHDESMTWEEADQAGDAQAETGFRSLVWKLSEMALDPLRFTKLEGTDEQKSRIWFDEAVAQGIVDEAGVLLLDPALVPAAIDQFVDQSALPGAGRAGAQMSVVFRKHIWASDRACEEAELFESVLARR